MKLIATQAENAHSITSSKARLQRLFGLLIAAALCCVPLASCADNSQSTDTKADAPETTQSADASKGSEATTSKDTSEKAEETAVGTNSDVAEITISVEVTGSFEDTTVESKGDYTVAAGTSALEALQATDLTVTTEDSQYGAYVTSVDGLTAEGSNGWLYSVNGESPAVSAGDYELADGDTVVWSFYVAE